MVHPRLHVMTLTAMVTLYTPAGVLYSSGLGFGLVLLGLEISKPTTCNNVTRSSATAEIGEGVDFIVDDHSGSLEVIRCCTNRRDFLLALSSN